MFFMTETDIVLKIKNASQNISANFFVKDVSTNFNEHLMTHVFIKQTLRAADPAPPFPPTGLSRGWGNSGFLNSIATALVMA
jgi:hypothetical protein